MGSCGLGTCLDPLCYLCRTVGKLSQPTTLLEHEAKYAVPVAKTKKQEPRSKKSHRKALEPYGYKVSPV